MGNIRALWWFVVIRTAIFTHIIEGYFINNEPQCPRSEYEEYGERDDTQLELWYK